jgi:hypothetical protein
MARSVKELKEAKGAPADWGKLGKMAKTSEAAAGNPVWNSQARKIGDTIMGTVGTTEDSITRFGPGSIMKLTDPDGKEVGIFMSKVIQSQLKAMGGVKPGDRVFFKYHGVPEGKRYGLYSAGKL